MDNDFLVHIGGDGVPFLTKSKSVPNYKDGLPDRLKPQSVRKVRVDVLDLSDEKHYEYYSQIWDAVGIGIATVVEEDKHWVTSKDNWKIFIRWYINGQMDPSELRVARLDQARDMVNHSVTGEE